MSLVERLLRETKRKHGLVRVCLTPDEEIGRGVDKLDLRMLGADVAYTLDGGTPGEICWETFSGDAAEVIIDGITTHTMEAKAKGMVNAAYLAGKLLAALPRERCAPDTTDGRDGFIHPIHVEGRTERAVVKFLLRDYKPANRRRASAASSANNIATWLTGCARICARLSWRGRRSWWRDSNPMITSSVAGPMAHA